MKYLLSGMILLVNMVCYAQDTTKKGALTINGSLDTYYRYNFQNAKDSGFTNNYTSFTNSQNSFELGMASVKADYAIGKVDGFIHLGFGRRAEENSYNDGDLDQNKNGFGSLANLQQAYISYSPSTKVKFTMGKWFTHVGYEVAEAYLNRNYSMDYMFSYGPFFHTGLKMDIALNSNFGFMVGVSNQTDHSTASFSKKNFIGQIHLATGNSKVNAYVNYIGGRDAADAMNNQFDLVATGTVSSKFSIGYNGTVKIVRPGGGSTNSWWGSALYLNLDLSSIFGLTARGEYFSDEHGVANVGGFAENKIFDFTLSGNIHIDNLTIIPELRLDNAEEPIFFQNSGEVVKNTGTFILGITYHF